MNGSYVLVIKLKKDSKIKIGKLGVISFQKGYYCYVGSAIGKTINLKNRVERHKRLNKEKCGKLKWHIDYFLVSPKTSIVDIIILKGKKMECKISRKVGKLADSSISKFGCSDCKCKSHFHYFKNKQKCKTVLNLITKTTL